MEIKLNPNKIKFLLGQQKILLGQENKVISESHSTITRKTPNQLNIGSKTKTRNQPQSRRIQTTRN